MITMLNSHRQYHVISIILLLLVIFITTSLSEQQPPTTPNQGDTNQQQQQQQQQQQSSKFAQLRSSIQRRHHLQHQQQFRIGITTKKANTTSNHKSPHVVPSFKQKSINNNTNNKSASLSSPSPATVGSRVGGGVGRVGSLFQQPYSIVLKPYILTSSSSSSSDVLNGEGSSCRKALHRTMLQWLATKPTKINRQQPSSVMYEVPVNSYLCLTVLFIYPFDPFSSIHTSFSNSRKQSIHNVNAEVQVVNNDNYTEFIIDPDLTFISSEVIVAGKRQFCHSFDNTHNNSGSSGMKAVLGTRYVYTCTFTITFTENGVYNISLRGDDEFLRIKTMKHSVKAFDGMFDKYYMGRYRELFSPSLYQIQVTTPSPLLSPSHPLPSSLLTSPSSSLLPLCTFQHELELWKGKGNPRWKKSTLLREKEAGGHVFNHLTIGEENHLRSIWYNDSYLWINDLCRYKVYSNEEILEEMDKKKIEKILLVGDSLTRFMWGDIEEVMSDTTQQWIEEHPITMTEANTTTLMTTTTTMTMKTKTKTMMTKTSWDQALSSAGGFGEYHNITGQCYRQIGIHSLPSCCLSGCPKHNGLFAIQQFLPGYTAEGDTSDPFYMPAIERSLEEWKAIFRGFIERQRYSPPPPHSHSQSQSPLPSILVFNTGLWLIDHYREKSFSEIEKIITAWVSLCQEYHIFFIWRSTLYHHRNLDMHHMIVDVNQFVINLLMNKFHHPYFLDSPYVMSALRPDRTVDGFHYNYRMVRRSWHRCTENDFIENINPDCVRDMTWPMSVSKAMTLSMINLLLNSNINMSSLYS